MKTRAISGWLVSAALLPTWTPKTVAAQQPLALTLGGAARMAVARSGGAEAARYRVEMAEARLRQQHADLLPSISGALSRSQRTFSSAALGVALRDPATGAELLNPDGEVLGPVRMWDLRLAGRQTLVDLAAVARERAGRAEVGAVEADAAGASQQAAAAAAQSYVRSAWADARLGVSQMDSSLAEELVGIAQRQRDAGLSTNLDVARASAQLAASRARLVVARTERERTRLELNRALGIPGDADVMLADSLACMPATVPAAYDPAAGERALEARAELRMLDAQMGAAGQRVTAIRAERLPVLSIFADGGSTGRGFGRLLDTYSWGLQVSIPVFDGLRREARLAEQHAAIRELQTQRRDLSLQVLFEVRVAFLGMMSAAEGIKASEEQLVLAEQELALAHRRFTEGVAGNADVVAALLGLSEARMQVLDARAAFQLARVALARAEGVVIELP